MDVRQRVDQEIARRSRLIADGARVLGSIRGLIDRLNEAGIPAGMELTVPQNQANVVTGRISLPAMETSEVEMKPSITTGVPMPNQPAKYDVFIDFHEELPRMSIARTDVEGGMYECFDLRADNPAVPTVEIVKKLGEYSENVIGKTALAPQASMDGMSPHTFR